MPGLVGTLQEKVILNCRRTGKGSSEIGTNSGRNTPRNQRTNERQGGRKKTRGKYEKIKEKNKREVYRDSKSPVIFRKKKENLHVS